MSVALLVDRTVAGEVPPLQGKEKPPLEANVDDIEWPAADGVEALAVGWT